MRLHGLLAYAICVLALSLACPPVWADEKAAAEKKADEQDEQAAEKEQVQEAHKRKPPVLKPKDISMPVPKRVQQPAAKKQAAKKSAARPAERQANPRLRRPQPRRHRAGAAFRLESMGRHVPLSPAMQFHLNRSGGTVYAPPKSRQSAATRTSDRGAPHYYPGVSRLPTQKPFANVQHPRNAVERYWPLLLEGREDPHTGVIIWSLP